MEVGDGHTLHWESHHDILAQLAAYLVSCQLAPCLAGGVEAQASHISSTSRMTSSASPRSARRTGISAPGRPHSHSTPPRSSLTTQPAWPTDRRRSRRAAKAARITFLFRPRTSQRCATARSSTRPWRAGRRVGRVWRIAAGQGYPTVFPLLPSQRRGATWVRFAPYWTLHLAGALVLGGSWEAPVVRPTAPHHRCCPLVR
jgi:hypothetical protein